jgi:HK97 family phage major capsid protein
MEIKTMTIEELEARKLAIAEELEADGADLDALESEVRAIKEELENRKNAEAQKAEIRAAVAEGAGEVIQKIEVEERKMLTFDEIRKSDEYMNAYAEFLKTGDDSECRSLLTENATGGTVAVPTLVEGRIRTAWENDPIMSRIRKTFIKGNLKVGFEISATDAGIHTEGATSGAGFVAEETLVLGIAELVPETVKKWITFSDEVMDMRGQEFLDYIMDEIEYKIVRKAVALIIADIVNAPTTADADSASVAAITVTTRAAGDIVNAIAQLSDEATNLVIIMSKAVYAEYKNIQIGAQYAIDPFDGLPVLFCSDCGTNVIVGDLDGVHANFPNGYEPTIKVDDLSMAEKDLVKVVGRLPIGHALTACGRFCVIKESA